MCRLPSAASRGRCRGRGHCRGELRRAPRVSGCRAAGPGAGRGGAGCLAAAGEGAAAGALARRVGAVRGRTVQGARSSRTFGPHALPVWLRGVSSRLAHPSWESRLRIQQVTLGKSFTTSWLPSGPYRLRAAGQMGRGCRARAGGGEPRRRDGDDAPGSSPGPVTAFPSGTVFELSPHFSRFFGRTESCPWTAMTDFTITDSTYLCSPFAHP